MKNLLQLGKTLSRNEQKSIVGGKTCPKGVKKYCFIHSNPDPEQPDAQLECSSCDDWSGPAGDQCREVCGKIENIPVLE